MRVLVAADNSELRSQLRQLLLGLGLECGAEDCVALADAAAQVPHAAPNLVVIASAGSMVAARSVIESLAAASGLPVLAVGPADNPQEILLTLRSGAREYVDQKRLREDLPLALEKLQATGAVRLRRGRVLAVTSASPGGGVTTVATNLAFALAQTYPGRVLLAELGAGVPSVSLVLDLEPRNGVGELLTHADRLDPIMVRQAVVEHPRGVHVLAHPPQTLTAAAFRPGAIRQAIGLLRSLYGCCVLDLGHQASDGDLEAMILADAVVVVVPIDVPSLRLCRTLLKELERRGVAPEKVRLVANRYGQRRQLPWRRVEEVLSKAVLTWIPDDPGTVNEAINNGRPLLETASRATITRRFAQLARDLDGQPKS
ncbi:MAG: hypothetical protein IT429_20840 [Gemmataceae bacterium]|nr:hypothetical protein [Gemmataceae bacterium]